MTQDLSSVPQWGGALAVAGSGSQNPKYARLLGAASLRSVVAADDAMVVVRCNSPIWLHASVGIQLMQKS